MVIPGLGDLRDRGGSLHGLDAALSELRGAARRLLNVRADIDEPWDQRIAGGRHRASRHHDTARRVGSGRVRRRSGIAVNHPDLQEIDSQNLVRNLRQRGFHALTVGLQANPDFQSAIRRHPHGGLLIARHQSKPPGGKHGRAVRRLFAERSKTDPDPPAVGLALALALPPFADVESVPRDHQASAIVAAVVVLARDIRVRHGAGFHQVVQPQLPRLAPDVARQGVHRQLHREANRRPRDAAIRHEARLVRRNAARLHLVTAEVVGPRQVARCLAAFQANGPGPLRIGAAVDDDIRLQRQQPAMTVRACLDAVLMLSRIRARYQMLAAILDIAKRGAKLPRQPGHANFFRRSAHL